MYINIIVYSFLNKFHKESTKQNIQIDINNT